MFDKARWSQLLSGKGGAKGARASLEYLCHTYRRPVLVYIRHQGVPSDAAEAVAHAFFGTLLKGSLALDTNPDRNRFRRILIAALERYLSENPVLAHAGSAAPLGEPSGEFFDPRLSAAQTATIPSGVCARRRLAARSSKRTRARTPRSPPPKTPSPKRMRPTSNVDSCPSRRRSSASSRSSGTPMPLAKS